MPNQIDLTDTSERRRRRYGILHFWSGVLSLAIAVTVAGFGFYFTFDSRMFDSRMLSTTESLLIALAALILLVMGFWWMDEGWSCGVSDVVEDWFD